MNRSIVRATVLGVAMMGSALAAQAASATAFTFDFTGANATAAGGSSICYGDCTNNAGLTLNVYGYHLNDGDGSSGSGNLSYATAEAYKGYGLGVLFGTDSDRDNSGTHQIDNVGSGVDFVALVFNQSVTLSTIDRAAYGITVPGSNNKSYDTAAAYMAYTGSASSYLSDGSFTQMAAGTTATGSSASSTIWLVAASTLKADRDDGFKITDLKGYTPSKPTGSVPEPATWAMMIVGMGVVGSTLRRRKTSGMSSSMA